MEKRSPPALEHEGVSHQVDSVLDARWVAKRLSPLARASQIRLLLFLTAPHTVQEMAAEFSVTQSEAEERLKELMDAGLVDRMDGAGAEFVVDLRVLYSLFEELEKLGSVRPEEHDDPLEQTMGVPVRGAKGPENAGAVLTVVRGFGWGRNLPLARTGGQAWILGRDGRCDIPLEYDAYASKNHAEVRFEGEGFHLRDLESTNGTHHNLKLLPSGGEARLVHGDLVGVGKTLLLFWDRPMVR